MNRSGYLITFVAVSICVGAVAAGCNSSKAGQGSGPAQTAALLGPESYQKNCQVCHGAKGEGVKDMGPKLQKLTVRITDDEQIRHIIRNGRGQMPAYKQMSEAELNALIAYIKTL